MSWTSPSEHQQSQGVDPFFPEEKLEKKKSRQVEGGKQLEIGFCFFLHVWIT